VTRAATIARSHGWLGRLPFQKGGRGPVEWELPNLVQAIVLAITRCGWEAQKGMTGVHELTLTEEQRAVVDGACGTHLFLRGIAGVGKTTVGVHWLRRLLADGVPAHHILVLVPQRRLAHPYERELRRPGQRAGAEVTIATLGSLARRMVQLFWPLITNRLSQTFPTRRPQYLTLEMVQYLMFKLLEPEIERNDYFKSVTIDRARLFGQLVDNLNKAAVVGFPSTTIGARLQAAFPDDPERHHIFGDVQTCVNLFRDYCRRYNLLDFSLQVELFTQALWSFASVQDSLLGRYWHLIVDNVEEDTPATHRLLREWVPASRSSLLIFDEEAGYRRFLGADDRSAETLREVCHREVTLKETRVMSRSMERLLGEVETILGEEEDGAGRQIAREGVAEGRRRGVARRAIVYPKAVESRFHPQMLDWVANEVARLVERRKVRLDRIVILSPLMGDALRFSLVHRLEQHGIESRTLRPSRPLHAEPAVKALGTLAKLAHPHWQFAEPHRVTPADIVQMLQCVLEGIDLVRASLFVEGLFSVKRGLHPFAGITDPERRGRLTEVYGERFDRLREWLEQYRQKEAQRATEDPPRTLATPIDLFFRRLFGEVLSQPGFGFHRDLDAVRIVSNLIASAQSFRQSAEVIESRLDLGNEYLRLVDQGILADQYQPAREGSQTDRAVLIAPAYTFLLSNQPVDYQFWLNVDSGGWNRRFYQPLTQPYVLSQQWRPSDAWTEMHEREASREVLRRVVTGLIRRCRRRIYLGISQYDERGFEQVGELRVVFDHLLRGGGGSGQELDTAVFEEEPQ
jgi:hypothetical protein